MSILYGNEVAVRSARTTLEPDYRAGSVLAFVTWAPPEDPRWFGARIPGEVQTVEFVTITRGPENRPTYSYESYEGFPLSKSSASDGRLARQRGDFLLSLRAAMMP